MVREMHECVYGIMDSTELTETSLSTVGRPIIGYQFGYFAQYGKVKDLIDRRKGYITGYYYCPYCGKKLDWDRFRACAKSIDEGSNE